MSKIQQLIDSGKIQKTETNTTLVNDKIEFNPPTPILKWVGGKTQILEKIIKDFPKNINNYHEIFLGGGSVLFGLLYLVENKIINVNGTVNAYDLNPYLINMYKIIQTKPKALFKEISKLIDTYNGMEELTSNNKKPKNKEEGLTSKESYYYWIRKQFNIKPTAKTLVKHSAMFIFLNKTCFRGLYREGPNGFNVPFGNYKNPSILHKEHLMEISNLIKNVEFHHMDFSESLNKPVANDFIYLDPPYAPENEKSFVGYIDGGFNIDKHMKLFEKCKSLKNIKWMMSNADVELLRSNFTGFNIESIDCKRSINSKNPGAMTKEIIIKALCDI